MTFSQSIQSVFSKYLTISGRASRSEFWYFMLFTYIVSAILSMLAYATGSNGNPGVFWSIIEGLFALAIILPSICVAVRRLHDIGKGGGWIFISLIPIIGTIWLLIYEVMPSQYGDNRFGPQPA